MTFEPPRLKGENNYDPLVDSLEHTLFCDPEEDRTVQGDALEADINEIVRRFGITGQLPDPRPGGAYGDFSEVTDFQSALNALLEAQEAFDALPSQLRERFSNDPAKFLEFVQDDDNYEEARKLGLLAEPEPDPAPVRVIVESGEPPSGDSPPAPPASGDG